MEKIKLKSGKEFLLDKEECQELLNKIMDILDNDPYSTSKMRDYCFWNTYNE